MNRQIYQFVFYLCSPLIIGYLILRAIRAKEYREGFFQRLGFVPQAYRQNGILIHCASVGETRAAEPLIRKLLSQYPTINITVSTSTPTGKQAVHSLFENRVQHLYFPIDWIGSNRRFLNRLKPQLVLLMETELWPNFLYQCKQNKISVVLANARLSKKSLKKYLKFKAISQEMFSHIDKVLAQYPSDKQNFIQLGVAEDKIELVGSIKFDIEISSHLIKQQKQLKQQWAEKRPVWIAASIHPAEFDTILKAHHKLLLSFPKLLLIGVPRHPERFSEFKTACDTHQLSYVARSDNRAISDSTQVLVGDTMGEMILLFGVADLAYMGGSLIERGGQNPLEPVACGLPVFMGESFYNFKDVGQILIDNQVLKIIDSGESLVDAISLLIKSPENLQKVSKKSKTLMASNRGSVKKTMQQIQKLFTTEAQSSQRKGIKRIK